MSKPSADVSRRSFLNSAVRSATVAAAAGTFFPPAHREASAQVQVGPLGNPLAGEVGITTSSLSGHLAEKTADGKYTLLDLPTLMRDELDMRIIDLNTSTSGQANFRDLEALRAKAEQKGCILTNLKLNQSQLDMNSRDKSVREHALAEYKRSIDAAAVLGLRWARPLPRKERPDMAIHIASYRELADYAADRQIGMLVENYGWMQSDPGSMAELIEKLGHDIAACPDTGNWDADIRLDGLRRSFPYAVTCDFKARDIGPGGEHPLYPLEECFRIGWAAGFHGPWCLEHAHRDRSKLLKDLAVLRDLLRGWIREASQPS